MNRQIKAVLRLGFTVLLAFTIVMPPIYAEGIFADAEISEADAEGYSEPETDLLKYDVSDDALFELVSLGILRGDEYGDLHLEDEVTRAEFAMIAARLIQIDETAELPNIFSDVSPDAEYTGAVNALAGYGFLKGDGDGNFRPRDPVTKTEVYKVLVSLLGYDVAALDCGGYPSGYLIMGVRLGLSGAGEDGNATRNFVAHRVYEAIDVNLLEPKFSTGEKTFQVSENTTLRSILYNNGTKQVIHQTGLLSSTRGAFLAEALGDIKDGQVEIEGVVYDSGNTDAESLLGRMTDYIAEVDQYGRNGILLGIRRSEDTYELSLSWDELLDAGEEGVEYYDRGKNQIAKISDSAILVRNGRRMSSWVRSDVMVKNGNMTLIDNNGDRKYDIVLQEEYTSAVVSRTGGNVIYFKTGYSYDEALSLNTEEKDGYYVEIRDAEGQKISVSDIQPDDVLSIAKSEDGEFIKIYTGRSPKEGVIDRITETVVQRTPVTCYTVNGQEFYTEPGRSFNYNAGDSVLIRLNFMGDAVEIESILSNYSYGWVYDIVKYGFSEYKVRMLLPGKLSERTRVDDTDPDNIVTTPYLRACNADIAEYNLASKLWADGSLVTAGEFINYIQRTEDKLIQFSCDSAGDIRTVDTPVRSGTGDERYYNSYEKTFGKLGNSAFGTTEQTDVIIVPTNSISDKRDFCAGIELDVNNQLYTIAGYNVDDITHIAEIVVLYASLNADAAASIDDNTETAIAESVETVILEDGSTALMVTLWCDGSRNTYRVSENAENGSEFKRIQAGTVFRYALNTSDELYRMSYEETLTEDTGYYRDGSADRDMQLYGMVEEIEYRDLSFSKNRYVHRLTVQVNAATGAAEVIDINVRNAPSMYLYDIRSGTIRKMTPEEIVPGSMKVYARVAERETKVLVFTQ